MSFAESCRHQDQLPKPKTECPDYSLISPRLGVLEVAVLSAQTPRPSTHPVDLEYSPSLQHGLGELG